MTDQTHTQTAQEHLDLRDILQLLRRQLRLILLVSALVIGAAVLYVVSVTPVYTARSLIMVDPTQQNLLEADDTMRRAPMIDNARVDSEVEILRAPATTLAVIQSAGLVTDDEFGPSVSFLKKSACVWDWAPMSRHLAPPFYKRCVRPSRMQQQSAASG